MSVDNYKPVIFTVDGNIGSGKSTFISELKNYIKKISLQDVNILFVQEPVDEWNKITDKNAFFEYCKNYLYRWFTQRITYTNG